MGTQVFSQRHQSVKGMLAEGGRQHFYHVLGTGMNAIQLASIAEVVIASMGQP